MPPDCKDNDQIKTPERTPAYQNGFDPNTEKLRHLLMFLQKAVENHRAEIKTLSAGLVGLSGTGSERADKIRTIVEALGKQVTDLTGGVLIVNEMMPILFVTIVEAYLKDVLIYAAGIDPSLMDRTGQTVTYQDALNARSLEELRIELRRKWARKFVDSGGPTTWIKTLEKMGTGGHRPETIGQMETLWGVRHLIVHSAGVANADFVRRHPELKAEVGKRFTVNNAQLSNGQRRCMTLLILPINISSGAAKNRKNYFPMPMHQRPRKHKQSDNAGNVIETHERAGDFKEP